MKISIITPSYNQEIFIGETILSVLNQDGNYDLEHIIIDGKSTDGTDSVLKKYKDKIRIICEKDNGQAEAINKGFSLASGEIIGWLNSDDIYHKDTIRRVIGFFEEHPDKQWAYGKCNIVDAHGMEIRRLITRYKNRRQKKSADPYHCRVTRVASTCPPIEGGDPDRQPGQRLIESASEH